MCNSSRYGIRTHKEYPAGFESAAFTNFANLPYMKQPTEKLLHYLNRDSETRTHTVINQRSLNPLRLPITPYLHSRNDTIRTCDLLIQVTMFIFYSIHPLTYYLCQLFCLGFCNIHTISQLTYRSHRTHFL